MKRLRLYLRAFRALWRVGLLCFSPRLALGACLAWRRCRGSLAFLAEVAALRAGSRLALVDDDGPLTFTELHDRAQRLAGHLIRQFSAGPGRQVAIALRNHRSFVVALLGAARTGADIVVLNPDTPPGVLAKLLSVEARAADGGGTPTAASIILHNPELDVAALPTQHALALGCDAGLDLPLVPLPRLRRPGRVSVLTAGSTGTPKRIARKPRLADLLPFVLGLLDRLPIAMHRPTVVAVPCCHGHGLATLATALAFAAPVYLGRRYEIAGLLARSPLVPPVVVSVPTLLRRWLTAGISQPQVAAVVTGSAPLDAHLCRDLLDAVGPVLFNLYGSSEAAVISLATPAMLAAAPGTVGLPLPGVEMRIVDATGKACPAGKIGRIHVRGPLVVGADATGWLDTGDLGRLDEAGRLHVCGRADGMFISGGENVYPDEVEACLREHTSVADAAITVVPDAEFGARMRAFVVACDGARLGPEELRAWLRQRLDRCKQPRSIELVTTLPRNPLGKIDRPALAQLPEPKGV